VSAYQSPLIKKLEATDMLTQGGACHKTLSIFLSKSEEYITNFNVRRFVMNDLKDKFSIFVGVDWANKKHDVCVQIGVSDESSFDVISHTP
jgi:hypothetical protein